MTRHANFRFTVLFVLPLAAIFLSAPIGLSSAQRRTPRPAAKPAAAAQPAAEQPKFKAIWEPVNYNQDLRLTDVLFVTSEEGWVSGQHGTILHTSDSGKTWIPQLGGDPQSQTPEIRMLRFVDRRHGWALQPGSPGKLLRTSDGENWEQASNTPEAVIDYQFFSPSIGLLLEGNANFSRIYHTIDGGRTWKETFLQQDCQFNAELQGLARQVGCVLTTLAAASPTVAYAVGNAGPDSPYTIVVKTQDAGITWSLAVVPAASQMWDYAGRGWQRLFFFDAQNGLLATAGDRLYATNDGGASWHGVAGTAGKRIRFADPQVGWAFPEPGLGVFMLRYTTDGGKRWFSRSSNFPVNVWAFSLPQRSTGYVVGEHGMIYRYRIVTIDYKVANMIDAPMMPGLTTPLDGTVATIREKAKALQAKLEAAQAKPGATVRPTRTESAPYAGAADAPEDPVQQPQEASAAGQAPGGFVQDVGNEPPSPFMQQCCAAEVQGLQTGVGSFLQEVPAFSTNFRPLNLIIAGLRLATDLLNKAQGVRSAFIALKTAPTLPAASAALQNFMTNLDGASQTITSRFQNTQSLTWPEAAASAASAAAGAAIVPQGGTGSIQPASTAQTAKPEETKKQNPTSEEIKNKLKKKFGIKFP